MTNLSPIEDIKKELADIDSYLNSHFSEDINECAQRGSDISVYIARTGKLLADCKFYRDSAIELATIECMEKCPSNAPSIQKRFIESKTKEENHLVNWCERLNRAATHQLQFLVTLISKAKEEMKFLHLNK